MWRCSSVWRRESKFVRSGCRSLIALKPRHVSAVHGIRKRDEGAFAFEVEFLPARQELLHSWLTKAAHDLKGARILSTDPEGPLDLAIYHCQQAGEKSVKAFLVFKGVTPGKTHDIRRLAVEASALESSFDKLIAPAAALTPYAWEFRYPDDLAETYPTREEFDEALQHAQAIYDFVVNLLPPEVRP